ncbi:glycoside hydrolase family 3 domain protein [Leadbetterella byssophila DSM 17132]|uniref:beta-N-acetylhexosaminidase n=1 Tax=Leadbetterella byssophila (strain DSM 17132 / JCM 16389 / KACC 11308 / NBRC 106382 / 4M15) TaxID=649349 RepID=E4RZ23_LEAB4|nr:glycoside hydrolase family 3 N-terminal domain-containing protein [Leadbetterella byssophila]ADQ18242.1 glycoside hydrolase family 3 domain protein [Leadbetterella byssophila DSM 17132]
MSKRFLLCVLAAVVSISARPITDYTKKQEAWVETILSEMTLEEKVGQLFMIAVFSNRREADYTIVENQIRKYHLGGLAFFQGNALKQAELTNRYQAAAKIPLLIGLDAEWGLGMRLNNAFSFPKAITIGAAKDIELAEQVSEEIARQCKRIGVHFNFSPVGDINSNPKNPVINYRSFGESPLNVSELTSAFVRGHRKYNILTSAKHFPGHGDTHVDSHYDLPVLQHSLKHIQEVESAPFKAMIADSVSSVMIGHLNVPALDNGVPATVSERIIKDYLQKELGFTGLVISDALNMKGLLKSFPVGEAEVRAFKAGNDMLLQTSNLDKAYNAVLAACINGRITEEELNHSVRKILKSKYWAGLHSYKPVDLRNISEDLDTERSKELKQLIYNKAVTVTRDEFGLIPLKGLATLKMASIGVGVDQENLFQSTLELYGDVNSYLLQDKPARSTDWKSIAEEAVKNDLVIVSIHKVRQSEKLDYGITEETLNMLRYIQENSRLIVCVFGNPYSLKFFDEFETVMCGFEDEEEAHMAAANVLFGVNSAQGKVPVNTLSADGKLDYGYEVESFARLGFAMPSEVGMSAAKLQEIRKVVNSAIMGEEFPGCQVLVARKGKVVFYEGFGNMKYNNGQAVNRHTLYDLASVTKVASTLQAIMMLYDQGKINLDEKLSTYLPELLGTNKSRLIIKDILLHQAGLKAFVPFFDQTRFGSGQYNPYYFSNAPITSGHIPISDELGVNPIIKDSVFSWVEKSALINAPGSQYVYSDLGLLLLQKLVERISGRNLDAFVGANIYEPMGLHSMMYNAFTQKTKDQIAPTEVNGDFRKAAIHGTVHDPNAALIGGVAGHAGLFSNAWDLARLMQMNLNGGYYDDRQFFSKETIDFFTKPQSKVSHRALGWNRPTGPGDGTVSQYASSKTYGHTGFTGTCVWVDPEKDLIFVFLSNRVYPSANNQKIIKNKTRQKIHDIAYKALLY